MNADAPTELQESWRKELGGRLTQPVVANGRLFAASVEQHTLHSLDAETGELLWTFIAGGRIDSPPTITRGLAVFGCRDGWVYALRSEDGQLAWRYRAAPSDSVLVDNGRVESVWPVHGAMLVQDDVVHFAAGRSSFVDGGVRMGKLDLLTGQTLLNRTFYSRDPQTGETVHLYEPFGKGRLKSMELPGVLPDILSSDGKQIWMRAVTFDSELNIQEGAPAHLFSSVGLLDDAWWELSYWIYGRHMFSGRAGVAHAIGLYPTARIMVCDEEEIYGYQEGYETIREPVLLASNKNPKTRSIERRGRKSSQVLHRWTRPVPLHVYGLVLAGDTLFLAGPPKIQASETRRILEMIGTDDYDPPPVLRDATATFMGEKGGLLFAVKKADGADVAKMKLTSIPVFDGLIAANGRLYASMKDGAVVCLGARE